MSRSDGEVKPYSHAEGGLGTDLGQSIPECNFDEVPTPHDLTLMVKDVGKLTVDYKVISDPGRKALAAEEFGKVRDLFNGAPPPFHLTFEVPSEQQGVRAKLRRFIIKTDGGHVDLEPISVTYDAAFGMCSVFADDIRPANGAPSQAERISN